MSGLVQATKMMIFVTQANTGTTVKRVRQEQMVDIRSYTSREPLSPPLQGLPC